MEVTGILMRKVGERDGVSQRTGVAWRIAEFLLEIPGQYPRNIVFRVSDGQQSRIARFESMFGKTVTVSFDIDAHEVNGRWFNEITAWGIMEYVAGRNQQPQTVFTPAPAPAPAPAQEQTAAATDGQTDEPAEGQGSDGLPF